MDNLIDLLNASLTDIKSDAFKDVVRIESMDKEAVGDGTVILISEIKRVILTLVTSAGQKRKLKAICKVEAKAGGGLKLATDTGAFATETVMYSKVLKEMNKLMTDAMDSDLIWAECYFCSDNKFLFEDLCEKGYRIVPTYKFLDCDHMMLVMEAVGKFHGMSMVMNERGKLAGAKFKAPFFALENETIDAMTKVSLTQLQNALKAWGPEWELVSERLEKYTGKPSEVFKNVWESSSGKWDVLCHGDFTMRNMLFHYQPGCDKPDGVKFVDFQMCHWSNLAFDLCTILYSSILPEVRDKNLVRFIQCYSENLKSMCKTLGYKGKLPTYDDIKSSVDSLHPLSTTIALFQLPFFIDSDRDDIQESADKYIEEFSKSEPNATPNSLINYNNKKVIEILQYELNRCMKEKLF